MAIIVKPIEPDQIIMHKGRNTNKAENTWSAIIKRVLAMNASDAQAYFGEAIKNIPAAGDQTIKELIVAKVVGDFLLNPSPGMLNLLMEREEGKVADTVNLNSITQIEVNIRRKEKEIESGDE